MFAGVKTPKRVGNFSRSFFGIRIGKQIQTRSEGSSPIGRGTDPTLQLHTLNRRGKIGHVYPKGAVTFGVVVGNPVDGYIHTSRIGTPNAYTRVPKTISSIGSGHYRGHIIHQNRNVLPQIATGNVFLGEVTKGDRCFLVHTDGFDQHFIQLVDLGGVVGLLLGTKPQRTEK